MQKTVNRVWLIYTRAMLIILTEPVLMSIENRYKPAFGGQVQPQFSSSAGNPNCRPDMNCKIGLYSARNHLSSPHFVSTPADLGSRSPRSTLALDSARDFSRSYIAWMEEGQAHMQTMVTEMNSFIIRGREITSRLEEDYCKGLSCSRPIPECTGRYGGIVFGEVNQGLVGHESQSIYPFEKKELSCED